MGRRERREALRGVEEEAFDLIVQVLTSEQWAELLKAPLERAAVKGNRGLAQKLVRAGAKIGDALHEAIRGGHGHVVNDLLENGASVDAKDASGYDYTPLHVASMYGKTEMVQLLLAKGADKNAMDSKEFTPLFVAALFGCVAAALALMVAGADVSLRCGQSKRSVVHAAAQRGLVDIMRAAIERGADVDAVDESHCTPLHWAVIDNEAVAIEVLVEAGANIEARDDAESTPLNVAAGQPSLEALLALLNHDADVNTQDHNQDTPLHIAAARAGTQSANVVDSLLRSGADETILNGEGKTAANVAEDVDGVLLLADDVERVRQLLANAPADRAWRRRGYLVLCRAHPDRMRLIRDSSSAQTGTAQRIPRGAKLGRTEASGCSVALDASPVDERGGDDLAVVVARVLRLQEEGIFRTIVGYL